MIEDTLKRMPLALLSVPYIPGVAFTANLKSWSLCDLILTLTPYVIESEELNQEVEAAIRAVRAASERRNIIVHGPFDFFGEDKGVRVQAFKARSKLTLSENEFGDEALKTALSLHIDAWQRVADCYVGMSLVAEERVRLGVSPLRPDFVERAKCRSLGELPNVEV